MFLVSFKMTSVQGHDRSHKECPLIALSDFFSSFELDDKLFDQFAKPLGANLSVVVIFAATFLISKYTKKHLQRISKTVLEARAPTT